MVYWSCNATQNRFRKRSSKSTRASRRSSLGVLANCCWTKGILVDCSRTDPSWTISDHAQLPKYLHISSYIMWSLHGERKVVVSCGASSEVRSVCDQTVTWRSYAYPWLERKHGSRVCTCIELALRLNAHSVGCVATWSWTSKTVPRRRSPFWRV